MDEVWKLLLHVKNMLATLIVYLKHPYVHVLTLMVYSKNKIFILLLVLTSDPTGNTTTHVLQLTFHCSVLVVLYKAW